MQPAEDPQHLRAFAHGRTVFIVCATMTGVCLTAGGLIRVAERDGAIRTLSRLILAVDSLVFLTGALASFAVSQAQVRGRESRLRPLADGAVVLGLAGIVVVCFTLLLTMT